MTEPLNSLGFFPSYGGAVFGSMGLSTLQANPYLRVVWFSYSTPGASGRFSQNLVVALDSRGIEIEPGGVLSNSLLPGEDISNGRGRFGSEATQAHFETRGYQVETKVPTLGRGVFGGVTPPGLSGTPVELNTGIRVVDIVATKWGFLGGEQINAESKVNYKSLNYDLERTGGHAYQLTRDAISISNNRLTRLGGNALAIVGAGLDLYSTGTTVSGQLSAGNFAGAALSGAEFAGRWTGTAVGTTLGTLLGGPVGGFFGGIVGAYGFEKSIDVLYAGLTGGLTFGGGSSLPTPAISGGLQQDLSGNITFNQ